ncbi:MAG TPA: sulfatase-like hydrolase/transferase, partial [Verrucomicrobiae bacterium]|nr:sulfatase-like hydrolase/transferase [Verrucomicrobiae bacterium]
GNWDLGDENSAGAPWVKGFDEFAGYLGSSDAEDFYANYIFRYAPNSIFDETNNRFNAYIGREPLIANDHGAKNKYIPDVFANAAVNFIEVNESDAANDYRPFFLLVNYEIPNSNIEVPTDAPFSEEPWPQPEKNRAALIALIDNSVGDLRTKLKDNGMTNNVVIFFSSGSLPEKTTQIDPDFFHSNLSSGDRRVPMIVCWPERIPAGQVSGYKWSPWDFLPTAAEIGYAKTPANVDGTSVLLKMTGGRMP